MLALSPLFSSGFGWNLDEPTPVHLEKCSFFFSDEVCSQLDNNNTSNNVEVDVKVGNLYHRLDDEVIAPPLVSAGLPTLFGAAVAEARSANHVVGSEQSSQQLFANSDQMPLAVEKKLNHNASERDRRRKMNGLYSSLRSLLPPSTHISKKLSIPATVSRVLKYIPELQKEVEELIQKKEELSHRRNNSGVRGSSLTQRGWTSLCSVQVTQISSAEVMIQISTVKLMRQALTPFSEVLREIELDGLSVVVVSYLESFGGRVFYTIHLLVEGGRPVQCEVLKKKLLSCYQRWETLCQRDMSSSL